MLILVAFQAFLLLLLLPPSHTTIAAGHRTKTIPTTLHPSTRLPLVHLDTLSSTGMSIHDYRARAEALLRRDAARLAAFVNKLSGDSRTELAPLGGAVAVMVSIGSPPMNQTLVMDTGSDLLWVQCKSCQQCFDQLNPTFDPTTSTSFRAVACDESDILYCDRLKESHRGCDSDHDFCTFDYSYVDGSYTRGTLALETLKIGDMEVENVTFGCGNNNNLSTAAGADGVLGLADGSVSLVSQSAGIVGSAFSYCMSPTDGWLEFGRSTFSNGSTWVQLVNNPKKPIFYYVNIKGLGVNGQRVPGVTADAFSLSDSGQGGAIIDTGTTITFLPTDAYVALREAFKVAMGNVPMGPPMGILDTCYQLGGLERLPTVSLFLSDDQSLSITSKSPMYTGGGLHCFAFAPSDLGLTIIGNIQQQGIRITIDATGGYIGFGPDVC